MSIHIPVPETELIIPPSRFTVPDLQTRLEKPARRLKIDWTNPLTAGLIQAFFFIGGDLRDYVNHDNPTVNTTAFSNEGLEQAGPTVIATWPPTHFNTGVGSIIFDFKANGTTPQANGKFIQTGVEWQIYRGADNLKLTFEINGSQPQLGDFVDMWDQDQHKFSAIWNDAIPNRRITVDNLTENATGAFTPIATSTDFSLLNRASQNREVEGRMTYCLIYAGRNLSRSDEIKLHENPEQILIPEDRVFFPAPELEFLPLPNRLNLPELLIPKRTPKSNQVEVDWAHPFTEELLSCFIWDSFRPHDLARNIPSDKVVIGGSAIIQDQMFLYFDRTANNEITIQDADEQFELHTNFNNSFSIMHVFRFDPNATADADQYTLHQTVLGSSGVVNIDLDTIGMTLYDGQIHCIILAVKLDTDEQMELWLDGVLLGTNTLDTDRGKSSRLRYKADTNVVEASVGVSDNTNLTIGGTLQFGTDRWHGHLMSFTSWKRFLPPSQAKVLSADPYQFLKPATKTLIPYEPNEILDGFWLSDPRFETGELFTPQRRPVGLVEIDWDRIPESIQAFFLMNNQKNLADPQLPFVTPVGSPVQEGSGVDFLNATARFETSSDSSTMDDIKNATELTVVLHITTRSVAAAHQYCGCSVTASAARRWEIVVGSADTNQFEFFKDNTGGDPQFTFAANTLVESGTNVYVFRWSNNDTGDLWRNDGLHEQIIDGDPGTFNSDGTKLFEFGMFDGIGHSVQVYNKALPDAICRSLSFDPYQFLIPA